MLQGLTYNTAQQPMVIPAYGRYVQSMLVQATKLEGERQQALVERIIEMMAKQFASDEKLSDEDLQRRLWKHAYRLADYQLTAVPPFGEIPTPDTDFLQPEEVPYTKAVAKMRNYGAYVQKLIEKAINTEDPERKKAITLTIASYMKLAYSNYSTSQNISEKTILSDLDKLSEGKLSLSTEDLNLDAFMGKGTQSHIKQTAPINRRKRRNKPKGKRRNRRQYRRR